MNTLKMKNGNEISYRLLQKGDEDALRNFHENLSERSKTLFTPHAYDNDTIAKAVARVENGNDLCYVAVAEDKIVAYFFLWWYDTEFPVLGIGIIDDYHGQGLGRQIMELLVEKAKEANCSAVELTTNLDNHGAFALYEKIGFICLGQVDNLTGDGRMIKEWHMYYPIKPDVVPPPREHCAPM